MEYGFLHAACLCDQLPKESRVARAQSPELEWGDSDYLLSRIEEGIRTLVWQQTKDGQKGRNVPKPNPTPADRARIKRKLDATDVDFVNQILGIKEA